MRNVVIVFSALVLLLAAVGDTLARGRTGSHRSGGVGHHGKWSHYVGGR